MQAIKSLLTARWFLTLIGALVLCLLVWFVGPLVAIAQVRPLGPDWARLIVVVAILVIWGLWNLFRLLRERSREKDLESGLAESGEGGAGDAASRDELRVLQQRLDDAVELLRKSGQGKKRKGRYLYELPWYMLIGPPGSGKTTALLNSGLRFPLGDDRSASVKGVGGTRNCDWWFADEAILLDTAGRYTTQDSQPESDRAAWTGFLQLLRRTRPRQPINGAFVAISLGDLMTMDEDERARHAQAVRSRLSELQSEVGVRFPIYVLFTKADLLSGFVEFFDDLGREDRAQVWGATLPFDDGKSPEGAVANFDAEFDALTDRLTDRALERVHQELDKDRRGVIFNFPTQVAALKPVLSRFLDDVFRPSRLEQRFLLRGFYFTSGTQEGRPIDRVMSAMSRALGLPSASGGQGRGGRAYFLHDLLRKVAFGEAGLVTSNPKAERRERLLRYGALTAAVAVVALAGLAWFVSYQGNKALVAEVEAEVQAYKEAAADLTPAALNDAGPEKVVPALNILRDLPKGHADESGAALTHTFGLYQGEKLGSQGKSAYRRGLEELLLPVLADRLEKQIANNLDRTDFVFEALKVYLMLGGKGPLDAGMVRDWMAVDWQGRFPADPRGIRQDLKGHLEALLTRGTLDYPLDGRLIRQARETLRQKPLAERAYSMIRNSPAANELEKWRLTDQVGRAGANVFIRSSDRPLDHPIRGLYTKRGFYEVFLPALGDVVKQVNQESWVLGGDSGNVDISGKNKLRRKLLAAYYRDYERAWRRLLTDLRFRSASSLDGLLDLVNDLASPTSPAVQLLELAASETALTEPPKTSAAGAADTAAKVADEASSGTRSRLARVLGDELSGMAQRPGKPVDEAFAALQKFVGGSGLDGYLSDLQRLLRRLEAASARGESLDPEMLRVASNLPRPVDGWMQGLSQGVRQVAVGSARRGVAQAWNGEVRQACREIVEGRYPFRPDSERAVPLEDFARVFGRGGLIESFYREHLKDMVDTSGATWRWKSGRPRDLGLPRSMPEQFRRASAIQRAFFGSGGSGASVSFSLKPLALDPQSEQVRLVVDGEDVTYSHGPPRSRQLKWPGSGNVSQARLSFTPAPETRPGGLTLNGPWAWFRLLDRSKIEARQSGDVLKATFRLGERHARFEIRADSVENPFVLDELRNFSCPPKL